MAHELFHEIDSIYGISQSGMLTRSIENDFRCLNNLSIGYGMNIADMLYSKYSGMFLISSKGRMQVMESYRGISDILNGMSQGQIQLGYGHKKTYWDTANRVEAETWAQYGRMMYEKQEDVHLLLNELFPETTKEITRIVTEMIK